jgi:hypothetical protein
VIINPSGSVGLEEFDELAQEARAKRKNKYEGANAIAGERKNSLRAIEISMPVSIDELAF